MGFLSKALNTNSSSSDSIPNVDKMVSRVKGWLNKRAAGDKGAGDLGEMSTGLASAKKGGTVKKTGMVKLHRGEKVLTRKQAGKKRA